MFTTDVLIRQLRRLMRAGMVVGACSLGNVSMASCPAEDAPQLAVLTPPTIPSLAAIPVTAASASASASASARSAPSQCLVSWAAVQDAQRVVVDIRSATAYAQLSVAGSLNIPASSLKNREFLKPQSLLLIDDGKSTSTVQAICDDLADAGFKDVRALQGGLRTLHAMGQAVVGSPRQIEQLGTMTAKEFHAVVGRPGWQVMLVETGAEAATGTGVGIRTRAGAGSGVSDTVNQAKALFIPVAKIIAEPVTPATLAHALSEATRETIHKNSATTVIIIGASDALRIDSQAKFSAEHRAQILFLADSLDGYAAFLNQQNLMLAQAGKPLVRPCTQW